METIKIQHLFGRFSIFFLVLIVAVFAEEYSINRLCLNINGLDVYKRQEYRRGELDGCNYTIYVDRNEEE